MANHGTNNIYSSRPISRSCTCEHQQGYTDDDGDELCMKCGRWVAAPDVLPLTRDSIGRLINVQRH